MIYENEFKKGRHFRYFFRESKLKLSFKRILYIRGNKIGYHISTIKNLPKYFTYYFFLIGDYRNHNLISNFFRDDFRIIADRIGREAVVIE